MKKMYSTKMINTGGRSGEVHNPDRTFELNIAALVNASKMQPTLNNCLQLVSVHVLTVH